MDIIERMDMYLNEGIPPKVQAYFDKFDPKKWDKEGVNLFNTFKNLIEKDKKKEALEHLQQIIRKSKNRDAIYIAKDLINL